MRFTKTLAVALFVVVLCACGCGTPYGVWHTVRRGETLYRIARTYNVPMKKIIKHNPQIKDPTLIYAGDKLFIPGASEVKTVPPPEQPPASVVSQASVAEGAKSGGGSSAAQQNRGGGTQRAVPPKKQEVKIPRERTKDFWKRKDLNFVWPVRGQTTARFGEKRGSRSHRGIDIAAPEGTPIFAAESGQVIFSGKISGYGKVIVIQHPSGFATVYAHNRKNLVRAGQWVRRGEKIAEVGKTGRASGPHVHFEIRLNNVPVDPLKYLKSRGG